MTDAIKRIRDALAAGPTPGEWFAVNDGTRDEPFMNVKAERISGRGPTHEVAICATGDSPQSMETANARYIAACHPAAIRELLAERDKLHDVLLSWDALIAYQFTGSRDAMDALHQCAQDTQAVLGSEG